MKTQLKNLRVYKPYIKNLPVKALYGIYLINLVREADEMGESLGRFVPVEDFPTLEEFATMNDNIIAARKGKGKLAKKIVRGKGGKRKQ